MARIENEMDLMEKLNDHINEENALFKGLKFAFAAYSILVTVLIWIFLEKNSDIKAMQATLNDHSVQISKTLALLEVVINNDKRQQDQIDRATRK